MSESRIPIVFVDDYHGGDVLFMQSLSRALSRRAWHPAPVLLHGSGEHAERLMEAEGIFRERAGGVLRVESAREHALVDRALRALNQKIVALLTDAVVSSVGVIGAQRGVFEVVDGEVRGRRTEWIQSTADQGVVSVVAASARAAGNAAEGGATGEIPLTTAAKALHRALGDRAGRIVCFTRTNLPGIMEGGETRPQVAVDDPALEESAADLEAIKTLVNAGLPVLLTNSNRLADDEGPAGTRVAAGKSAASSSG